LVTDSNDVVGKWNIVGAAGAWLLAGCVGLPRAPVVEPLPERLPEGVRASLVEPADKAGPATLRIDRPPEPRKRLTLPEAMAVAVLQNPRLRAYQAAIDREAGKADAAFAPFLPQIDVLTRGIKVNENLGPGAPGIVGVVLPDKPDVPYSLIQTELQVQWTLYDFGRTGGRWNQALSREKIAGLRYARARETVAYDAAAAYLQGLQTTALRVIQEEAIRDAQAVLEDTRARQKAGVVLRDAVLRGQVQLAESREGRVLAEESELDAQARLNNVLGHDASLPIELIERDVTPQLGLSLPECIELAMRQRPEVAMVRETIAAASFGRDAAAAELCPRIYLLHGSGFVFGENIREGGQAGAGIHLSQPLYQGGRLRAEVRAAEAEIQEAMAQARVLTDAVSLDVTLAYRRVTAARQTIDLARPAVAEAVENLRLMRERYRNGDAMPTDIVDAQTALTRARQRLVSSTYAYQIGLARLDYAMGNRPGCLLEAGEVQPSQPDLPAPRKVPDTLPAPRLAEPEKVEKK
jgi:outer membrane protein TolC